MARFKHLEIYQQTYKLNREIFRIKQKLPKTLKFDLGEFVFRSSLRMIRGIVIANGTKDKSKVLQQIALVLCATNSFPFCIRSIGPKMAS